MAIVFVLHSYHPSFSSQKDINLWMGSAGAVRFGAKPAVGALRYLKFRDSYYVVASPIRWKPKSDKAKLKSVTVPKGFVTDLASIPRVFWSSLRPDGEYAYAAVIHDYLYWVQDRSRKEADAIFLACMLDFKVSKTKAITIYNAVRLLGESYWNDNNLQKERGDPRFSKRFPKDPTINWVDWRKDRKNVR
ncbi:MAG: DUF1353 domain-containing protein [Boseongicola sp.]